MRSLAACYSEHAIKISEAYCSGPSNRSYLSSTFAPSIPDTVTTTYKSNIPDKPVSVSLTWSDNLTVVISTPPKSYSVSLKKPKGSRKFTSSSGSVNAEILWDLSEAEYENGRPEPTRRFSVAVVINSEITLRIGDVDHESLWRDTSSWRVSRTARFSGTCWLSTKAQFSDAGTKHEIQIQCGGGGGGGKEEYIWKLKRTETMSVWVDKRKVFEVKKLKWNFRGNQTMFFDGMLIDMMWDLHDWFFKETTTSSSSKTTSSSSSSSSSSLSSPPSAVFMFRRRSGLDRRLWLEEDEEENKKVGLREAKHSFSLIICVSKK